MAYENVILEKEGGVAVLTINRPKVLNALNAVTIDEIEAAVDDVAADDAVRALVITGAGEKSFVAGADINELRAVASPKEGAEVARRGQRLFLKIERLDKAVIMAVNGFAFGGGCELMMAGDFRLAADTAKLGLPEINLGLMPGYGGTQRLARLVGKGMAKFMVFTGDPIDAQEALRIGLVQKVVPAAELLATAKALAAKLAQKAPVALAMAKRAINDGLEMDVDRGCGVEATSFGILCATEDMAEGTAAFLEKRKAVFKGK